ncbi:MAG: RICIN domain-containing protein [Oligoflexales bacterium]
MLKKLVLGTLAGLTLFSSLALAEFDRTKWYKIRPLRDDGKVYDICGRSYEDCSQVILYDDNNTDNQKFKFKKTMWGTYTIHPMHEPTKVLDIAEGKAEHGTPLILYHTNANNYSRSKNQEFNLSRIGGDLYRIVM